MTLNKGCSSPPTLEKSQILEYTNIGLFWNVEIGFDVVLSITIFLGDAKVKISDIPILNIPVNQCCFQDEL